MFMKNVDGDHYFLSLIANSSVQSEFSFYVWIIVDIFNFIKSLLRKQEIYFAKASGYQQSVKVGKIS